MLRKILITLYLAASIAVFIAIWQLHSPLTAWIFAGFACGVPSFVIRELKPPNPE